MALVYIMDPVYVSYVKYGLIGKTITKPPYQTTSFFFYLGFLSRTFTNQTAGEGGGHSLTPHYHFHPLDRHFDISRAITAESSALHIASSPTGTGNLWFPRASH